MSYWWMSWLNQPSQVASEGRQNDHQPQVQRIWRIWQISGQKWHSANAPAKSDQQQKRLVVKLENVDGWPVLDDLCSSHIVFSRVTGTTKAAALYTQKSNQSLQFFGTKLRFTHFQNQEVLALLFFSSHFQRLRSFLLWRRPGRGRPCRRCCCTSWWWWFGTCSFFSKTLFF